jgi:hypothetical protein
MTRGKFGAVFLAILMLAALPALAATPYQSSHSAMGLLETVLALGFVAGTVTVTYAYPSTTTTAATAVQASQVQVQVCTVNWGDADTTTLLTHNWLSGTNTGPFPQIAQFMPEVIINNLGLGTALPFITVAWTNSVAITLGKTSSAGTGGSVVVTMRRPTTAAQ